jgi:hypothetical protein
MGNRATALRDAGVSRVVFLVRGVPLEADVEALIGADRTLHYPAA